MGKPNPNCEAQARPFAVFQPTQPSTTTASPSQDFFIIPTSGISCPSFTTTSTTPNIATTTTTTTPVPYLTTTTQAPVGNGWTLRYSAIPGASISNIAYHNMLDRYVFVLDTGFLTGSVDITSDNGGSSWITRNSTVPSPNTTSITYSSGYLIKLISAYVYWSVDGITWTILPKTQTTSIAGINGSCGQSNITFLKIYAYKGPSSTTDFTFQSYNLDGAHMVGAVKADGTSFAPTIEFIYQPSIFCNGDQSYVTQIIDNTFKDSYHSEFRSIPIYANSIAMSPDNKKLVAISNTQSVRLYTLNDAIQSAVASHSLTNLPATNSSWKNIAWANGKFYIFSITHLSSSIDGITWSSPVALPEFLYSHPKAVDTAVGYYSSYTGSNSPNIPNHVMILMGGTGGQQYKIYTYTG